MSNTQFAFLKKDNIPGKKEWQEAIDSLNFDIRLGIDPELAPFEDEGFSPCQWGESDDDVGFEIFYEPTVEVLEDDLEFLEITGENDYCISMCWGGSMKDCAAVMIASCALARDFGAVISYEGDPPEELDTLVEQTQDIIIEAEKEQSESPVSIDYTAIAQEILQTIKGNFLPEHQYLETGFENFVDLDIDFYSNLQNRLEAIGFVLLCDIEDKTLSEQSGIKTLIRNMRNPQSETLAAFYYIPAIKAGFFEFENFLSDGNIVASTTIPESDEITNWPDIFTSNHPGDIDEKQMYRNHLESIAQFCGENSEAFSLEISSFKTLVEKQNYMNRKKHDQLKSIGWVTREHLLAQANGDKLTANAVFEAIQKLLVEE